MSPPQESHAVSDSAEGDVAMGESSAREEPAATEAAASEEAAAAAEQAAAAAEEAATAEAAAARTDDVLHGLGEDLHQLQSEAADVEARLARSTVSSPALKEIASAVPVLGGRVAVLETRLDAAAADGAARQRRKELVQQAAILSERVQLLPPLLAAKVVEAADRHKAEGNEHYKKLEFAAAIHCYTEAIGVQRANPVFYSNRSSCHQAQGSWALGLADAKQSLALDVGFVKGYLHAVRCHLQLGALAEAAASSSVGWEPGREHALRLAAVTRRERTAAAVVSGTSFGDTARARHVLAFVRGSESNACAHAGEKVADRSSDRPWPSPPPAARACVSPFSSNTVVVTAAVRCVVYVCPLWGAVSVILKI